MPQFSLQYSAYIYWLFILTEIFRLWNFDAWYHPYGHHCTRIRYCFHILIDFYRPQRSCGQGNVFTGVCLSTGGEGVCLSACWDAIPPRDQGDTPPDQADPPGPGRPPWDQADTPPGTRQTPPLGRRLQHTVYERPVRILLECILVTDLFDYKLLRVSFKRFGQNHYILYIEGCNIKTAAFNSVCFLLSNDRFGSPLRISDYQ